MRPSDQDGRPFRLAFALASICYISNLAFGSPVVGWISFALPFAISMVTSTALLMKENQHFSQQYQREETPKSNDAADINLKGS
jgi:hypothetical protein